MIHPYFTRSRLVAVALTLWLALAGLAAQAQKVGINTPTPTQTLDVNGSLRVRGLNGTDVRLTQVQPDGTLGTTSPLPAVTVLSSPPNLGSVPVSGVQGVAVAGNYLYVTQTSQLMVFDITNPVAPVAVGTPVAGGTQLDLLTVAGDYLYVCDRLAKQLRVYTTASPGTPTTPSFVTAVATAGVGPNGAAVVGSTLYVAEYNASTIERFSLANPALPATLGSIPAGTGVAGLAALNGYLYAANFSDYTLQTFSIDAGTGALTSVNVQTVAPQPNAVATANGLLYLTLTASNTLQTFSLSNPAAPASLGTASTGGRPYGFAVKGNYAYISNTTAGTIEVRQLTQANALGFDGSGNLTSVPGSALGDNLGNHTATQNLNLNGSLLVGGTLGTPGTSGVFVSPAGVVGVGTTTPLGRLDVQGGADNTGANDPGGLAFSYRTGGLRHFIRSRHNFVNSGGGNELDFYLNNSATTAGSSIAGTGNIHVLTLENNSGLPRVGIGTTAPAATLDVRGTASVTGPVQAASVAATGTVTAGSNMQVPAANAYRYATPKQYSITYGASDFQPETNAAANGKLLDNSNGNDEAYVSAAGGVLRIPVRLPQGAVITNIVLMYYDFVGTDITLALRSLTPSLNSVSTYTTLGTISPTGTPGYTSVILTPASTVTIDNNNTYYVRALFGGTTANLTITGVRINYTVTQTE